MIGDEESWPEVGKTVSPTPPMQAPHQPVLISVGDTTAAEDNDSKGENPPGALAQPVKKSKLFYLLSRF